MQRSVMEFKARTERMMDGKIHEVHKLLNEFDLRVLDSPALQLISPLSINSGLDSVLMLMLFYPPLK